MRADGLPFAIIISLFLTVGARAGDPFLINVNTTSGTPQSTSVSGASLPNLVNDLIKGHAQFSSLQDRDIAATIRYGGENNAILLTRNAANTSATLTIPSIAFKKTFTGTSESDLEKQIENYAKQNGAEVYGKFIRSLNQTTPLGVTDGNPLATTALLAKQAYEQFGLLTAPIPPAHGMPNPLDQVATPDVRFDINGGYAHTDTGSGYYVGGAFSFGFKFGDRLGLVFATPLSYRNVQGADVYNVGEEISLPILLIEPDGDKSLSWLVTPTAFGGIGGSYDLAAGGTFIGGGVTSALSFQFDSFIFTLANHYDYFHGFPVSFGHYKLETNLDQEVLKNGVKVTKFFGDSLFIDGGVTYTNFLQKAAVREYWTPAAGIGFRFGSNSGFRFGYTGDFGSGFMAQGGEMMFYFNY